MLRSLPRSAAKVLDARGILDDFYPQRLVVLAWTHMVFVFDACKHLVSKGAAHSDLGCAARKESWPLEMTMQDSVLPQVC